MALIENRFGILITLVSEGHALCLQREATISRTRTQRNALYQHWR